MCRPYKASLMSSKAAELAGGGGAGAGAGAGAGGDGTNGSAKASPDELTVEEVFRPGR